MNQLSTNLTEFIQAKTKFPLVEKINSLTWRETDIQLFFFPEDFDEIVNILKENIKNYFCAPKASQHELKMTDLAKRNKLNYMETSKSNKTKTNNMTQ